MKKLILTLAALLATGVLVCAGFHFPARQETAPARMGLVRVWVEKQESSLWQWLRKQAKWFEKETGIRVYLRAAPAKTTDEGDAIPPDLLISDHGGKCIAAYGYALFVRDETASRLSPAPTSLLFFRPTPTPGPSPTPGPTPDINSYTALLMPEKLAAVFPKGIRSAQPVQDFIDRKGDAAVLSAEQAAQLSFPVRAYPLSSELGRLPIYGMASTPAGEQFLILLLSDPAQSALSEVGLYSPANDIYSPADPIRDLIESGFSFIFFPD